MRYFCVLFAALTVALIAAPVAAQAQETQSSGAKPLTRIEADSESHEIRFYIDDELAAVLKTDGLHVRGGISSTGAITNHGWNSYNTFSSTTDTTTETGGEDSNAP